MIDKIVLITGPMRSGTSLVAQIVHRLGWHASPLIGPPIPPSWRSDWEDPNLTLKLLDGLRPSPDWWRSYMNHRRTMSLAFGFKGRFAIKSPYLALVWPRVMEVVTDPFVIRTYRNAKEMDDSFMHHPQLQEEHQEAIKKGLRQVRPDIEIGYEWAVEEPKRMVNELAAKLGVEDDQAMAAAVALIHHPTRYL